MISSFSSKWWTPYKSNKCVNRYMHITISSKFRYVSDIHLPNTWGKDTQAITKFDKRHVADFKVYAQGDSFLVQHSTLYSETMDFKSLFCICFLLTLRCCKGFQEGFNASQRLGKRAFIKSFWSPNPYGRQGAIMLAELVDISFQQIQSWATPQLIPGWSLAVKNLLR